MMNNAQEIYVSAVRVLPTSERLRLAAMILNELTESETPTMHDEIAAYAAANAGSEADLDAELEAAGVEHLIALEGEERR
ncbi:MAG: hypothetical protein H0T45_05825 [Pyrinomonadaceae bacterium]|nr:hypothetical protein [Pyrinomonadaceae bacterium]